MTWLSRFHTQKFTYTWVRTASKSLPRNIETVLKGDVILDYTPSEKNCTPESDAFEIK